MSEPFLGEIRSFAFNFAPKGWALCNGQLLTIAQNQALFSILGTTYGGNGTTNFALPDLRGRTPMHPGQSLSAGTRIGVETMTLLISQLPAHTHTIVASSAEATLRSPAGSMPAAPNGENIYTTSTPDTAN